MQFINWIFKLWKKDKCRRNWGEWVVVKDYNGCKVKDLIVKPRCALSYQRHLYRSEFWFVQSGKATVTINNNTFKLDVHDHCFIPVHAWHQLKNDTDTLLHVIEIQYGEHCIEEDIERKQAFEH